MATVVITILNEETSVIPLLEALNHQTLAPNEVIIVDGGSQDSSVEKIKNWQHKKINFSLKLLIKKGNRSECRNLAISQANSSLIAITDAGCIPKKDWLENLIKTQTHSKADVVSGYYEGSKKNLFSTAATPYFLVMPDQINYTSVFLPATRSMLLSKNAWIKCEGFDEGLSDNEDFIFAHKLQKNGFNISFSPEAIVIWDPPQNLRKFTHTIFRFARGDIFAGIIRRRVIFLFTRYILGIILLGWSYYFNYQTTLILVVFLVLYAVWSILKNKHYVGNAWIFLPLLQFCSDLTVIAGSIAGMLSIAKRSLLFEDSRLK